MGGRWPARAIVRRFQPCEGVGAPRVSLLVSEGARQDPGVRLTKNSPAVGAAPRGLLGGSPDYQSATKPDLGHFSLK
jgi:hypothetical protein